MSLKEISITWLSANKLGYELLKTALQIPHIKINGVIILSENASTKMYDGIRHNRWNTLLTPVFSIRSINDEEQLLRKLSSDYIVMCGWRQIVDKKILSIPKKGFIGFHPTLLPKGRGPAPIINSILENWTESGVTLFYLDEQVDHGDIIGQMPFFINKHDHADDVYKKVIKRGKALIRKYIPMLRDETAPRMKQIEHEATYFSKRSITDNEINKNDSLDTVFGKIRAFSKPYLGAYIKIGDKKIVIWRANIYENR